MIVYDLRRFGNTKAGEGPFSFVTDFHDFMPHLGLKSAYLLGLGLDGCIVRRFAFRYPERVDALLMVGAGGFCIDVEVTEDVDPGSF